MQARWQLHGIEDAASGALDADGRLIVADRADLELRAFDLNAL